MQRCFPPLSIALKYMFHSIFIAYLRISNLFPSKYHDTHENWILNKKMKLTIIHRSSQEFKSIQSVFNSIRIQFNPYSIEWIHPFCSHDFAGTSAFSVAAAAAAAVTSSIIIMFNSHHGVVLLIDCCWLHSYWWCRAMLLMLNNKQIIKVRAGGGLEQYRYV